MGHKMQVRKTMQFKCLFSMVLTLGLVLMSTGVHAGAREQAKRIHDRLAGVPASNAVIDAMEACILDNTSTACTDSVNDTNLVGSGPVFAAHIAMQNSAFYNATVKNFASPWTNEEQDIFVPLNDYSATVIGMVRDNTPFSSLLSADIIYTGSPTLGLPAYSATNNNHYIQLENRNIDMSNTANLVAMSQSAVTGLPANATAGVMTTRAAARAFFIDGTNRAMFRFTMLNHLCNDMEQIKDNTRAHDRVRQDVSRSPGGDSRIFFSACVGCHAGMEPLTQAYAYYNFEYTPGNEDSGRLVYTPGNVQPKYLINAGNFKYGYVTTDDRWDNYWRVGPNSLLGWDTNNLSLPSSGNGAKTMGRELGNTYAFATCQVKKVFKTVCLRGPTVNDSGTPSELTTVTAAFKSNNYNMKMLFAETAEACMGN
jgi:hypothetical protein